MVKLLVTVRGGRPRRPEPCALTETSLDALARRRPRRRASRRGGSPTGPEPLGLKPHDSDPTLTPTVSPRLQGLHAAGDGCRAASLVSPMLNPSAPAGAAGGASLGAATAT